MCDMFAFVDHSNALRQKQMLFAIGQQQYLQGYVPVAYHQLRILTGMLAIDDLVVTGPDIVQLDYLTDTSCADAPICAVPVVGVTNNITYLSILAANINSRDNFLLFYLFLILHRIHRLSLTLSTGRWVV